MRGNHGQTAHLVLTITLTLQVLILLLVANGLPVLAKRLLGDRWAWPVDAGQLFLDGRALLGASKTWRGVLVAIVGCSLVAAVLGLGALLGFVFGLMSMLGDTLSSFCKRRLKLPPSAMALGLDQIPEALLPLLVCRSALSLDTVSIFVLVALFAVSELLLSPLMYRLGIREKPY